MEEKAGEISISYTYDGNGNQLTMTDSTGTTTRTYDELNRVVTKALQGLGSNTFEYDITEGLSNGCYAEKSTDLKGNVTEKIYDGAHNQTAKTETINGVNKGTTEYVYDKLNRLTKVTEPSGKVTEYAYDQAGNRDSEIVSDGATRIFTEYTYNEQNRLMSTVVLNSGVKTTTKYGYDHNGNLTSKLTEQVRKIDLLNPPEPHFGMFIPGQENEGATQHAADLVGFAQFFEYDVFNQMIKSSTGNAIVEMTYYGDGLRATKTTGGQTTRFVYEGDQVVLELDGKGNESARNVYGNILVSRTVDGQTLWYFYNGHADVTALLDSIGNIQATYYYDAFGNILQQTGTVNNPYTYCGYAYDESGLYYLQSRYYDPVTARFLSEDTYYGDPNDPLSLNLYTYCHNEPLMYTDPSGHIDVYGNETDIYAFQASVGYASGYNYILTSSSSWSGTVTSGSIVVGGTEAKGGVGTNVDLSGSIRIWGDTRTDIRSRKRR